MKIFLCGTMIFLSVSVAYAEQNVTTNMGAECVEPIGLAIDQPVKVSPKSHANAMIVTSGNQTAPIDCTTTPYVGVCESLEDVATTY